MGEEKRCGEKSRDVDIRGEKRREEERRDLERRDIERREEMRDQESPRVLK